MVTPLATIASMLARVMQPGTNSLGIRLDSSCRCLLLPQHVNTQLCAVGLQSTAAANNLLVSSFHAISHASDLLVSSSHAVSPM